MTPNPIPAAPTAYYRQLDGIRAVAVVGVMASHWTSINEALGFSLGALGVNVFFVLSGFLITQILLRARDKTERQPDASRGGVLKAFYARRALRIFPVYYATIIIGALVGWGLMREHFVYDAMYLSNVRTTLDGDWPPLTGHFWSLAVEEQYYLFWPLLVLFLPRRSLLPVTIGMILLAPLFRLGMSIIGTYHAIMAAKVMTPGCLDCLCGGALLAYAASRKGLDRVCSSMGLRLAGGTGLIVFLVASITASSGDWHEMLLVRSGAAVFGVALIAWAVQGINGPVGTLLSIRPVVYLGRISYGLYVLHNFAPKISTLLLNALDIKFANPTVNTLCTLGVSFIVTVALASLSWFAMEAPLNKLKRHFPYTPKSSKAVAAT